MIGTASFLLETAGALIGLIFVVAGLAVARTQRGGLVLVLVGGAFLLLMGLRYSYQCRAHAWLEGLQAGQVRIVRLGPEGLTDPVHVHAFVQALNDARWFSPNHGGWGREVPLHVESDPPAPVNLSAALYLRQEGAILRFSRGGGWSDGYAFVPGLPAALAAAGAPLPKDDPSP